MNGYGIFNPIMLFFYMSNTFFIRCWNRNV